MKKSTGFAIAAVAALVLAGGVTHYSSDDSSRDNTPPSDVCEDEGFKNAGKATTVTINSGDTVSLKATKPLADELGVSMEVAARMVEAANPAVYNLDEVGEGSVINVPNCTIKPSHG